MNVHMRTDIAKEKSVGRLAVHWLQKNVENHLESHKGPERTDVADSQESREAIAQSALSTPCQQMSAAEESAPYRSGISNLFHRRALQQSRYSLEVGPAKLTAREVANSQHLHYPLLDEEHDAVSWM